MPSITRRELLCGVAAASAIPLAGCNGSNVDRSQHWTQYGYDPANTAASPAARGPRPDPTAPTPDWVHVAGSYFYNSTQVLVGDAVYANAGYDGLYSLSPERGRVRWHDPSDYKPLTPALADGVVLPGSFGFRRVATDGGLDVAGHRLGYRDWQTEFLAYPQSPPTVADDLLVAGVGTTGHTSGGGRVLALDLADGSTRWSAPVGSTVWGAPAVGDDVVYAAQRSTQNPAADAALYALDRADGTQRWRRDFGDDPRFDPIDAPVLGDGLVYLSTGTGPLVAVDADSGDTVWTLDSQTGVQGSPALADGVLYVGDLDGTFHALDATTGESLWTASIGKCLGGPTVGADGVYGASFDGTLVAWDHDGGERWHVTLDPPVHGSPVVAGERVYVGTTDGLLYALS